MSPELSIPYSPSGCSPRRNAATRGSQREIAGRIPAEVSRLLDGHFADQTARDRPQPRENPWIPRGIDSAPARENCIGNVTARSSPATADFRAPALSALLRLGFRGSGAMNPDLEAMPQPCDTDPNGRAQARDATCEASAKPCRTDHASQVKCILFQISKLHTIFAEPCLACEEQVQLSLVFQSNLAFHQRMHSYSRLTAW